MHAKSCGLHSHLVNKEEKRRGFHAHQRNGHDKRRGFHAPLRQGIFPRKTSLLLLCLLLCPCVTTCRNQTTEASSHTGPTRAPSEAVGQGAMACSRAMMVANAGSLPGPCALRAPEAEDGILDGMLIAIETWVSSVTVPETCMPLVIWAFLWILGACGCLICRLVAKPRRRGKCRVPTFSRLLRPKT